MSNLRAADATEKSDSILLGTIASVARTYDNPRVCWLQAIIITVVIFCIVSGVAAQHSAAPAVIIENDPAIRNHKEQSVTVSLSCLKSGFFTE